MTSGRWKYVSYSVATPGHANDVRCDSDVFGGSTGTGLFKFRCAQSRFVIDDTRVPGVKSVNPIGST